MSYDSKKERYDLRVGLSKGGGLTYCRQPPIRNARQLGPVGNLSHLVTPVINCWIDKAMGSQSAGTTQWGVPGFGRSTNEEL